jgi:hypothetical protein
MKKILLGLLEFLQEPDGGNSSRRLIFVYGSLVAIPLSYYFACKHKDLFDIIHTSNLWFLAALGGLSTASNVLKK